MTLVTVVIPTFDHGPTLVRSVGSVLAQTVDDLELFVVGDGVPDATRAIVVELMGDPRVRFFDFPKGPRTGEVHRHVALQEARGEVVCYLSDDDLWLPHHLETVLPVLRAHDFAQAWALNVGGDGSTWIKPFDVSHLARRGALERFSWGISLSSGAHTLAAYRRLPYGWRTSPPDWTTDCYMWQQILSQPGCRAASTDQVTVLHFASALRRGWTMAQRLNELDAWVERMARPEFTRELLGYVMRDRSTRIAERDRERARLEPLRAGRRLLGRVAPAGIHLVSWFVGPRAAGQPAPGESVRRGRAT